ncbi:MAG: hypothetical protein V4653_17165 [Pseudomonadota bacterium]
MRDNPTPHRLLTALALLLAPSAASAQTGPDFPGLRGLGPLHTYIAFVGRDASIAECGITEPYAAELMASIRRELAPAGITITPGAERVPMTDGLLVRAPGNAPGRPTLAITAATLSVTVGQVPVCTVAMGFVLRTRATGITIPATGHTYDGDAVVWSDDATQLRDAASLTGRARFHPRHGAAPRPGHCGRQCRPAGLPRGADGGSQHAGAPDLLLLRGSRLDGAADLGRRRLHR